MEAQDNPPRKALETPHIYPLPAQNSHPRPAAADFQMARYVHDKFASFGIPGVEIQPVDALLSNPIESSLKLLDASNGSVLFTAALSEDVLDLDTTSDTWFRNHTYNG